ncbi:MAG: hypothetical protein V4635_08505 [Bacteroidota bacterium]
MKKILLISGLTILLMASCKKERTCSCTTTTISSMIVVGGQTFTQSSEPTKTVIKYDKARKGAVDCKSSEDTSTGSGSFSGFPYSAVVVTKTDCSLD